MVGDWPEEGVTEPCGYLNRGKVILNQAARAVITTPQQPVRP